MLKKLMKYEFLATYRYYAPIFAGILVMAGLNRLLMTISANSSETSVGSGLTYLIYILLILSLPIVTLVISIWRYSKNLLEDEGYLMFTLPVTTNQLFFSKYFTTLIWEVASFVIAVGSAFLIGFFQIPSLSNLFGVYLQPILLILVILSILAVLCASVFSLYTVVSLSYLLFKEHRILGLIVSYIIYSIVSNLLTILISAIIGSIFANIIADAEVATAYGSLISIILCYSVLGVLCYFFSHHCLTKKLNLQ